MRPSGCSSCWSLCATGTRSGRTTPGAGSTSECWPVSPSWASTGAGPPPAEELPAGEPAVDEQVDSGTEAGCVAEQKYRWADQLVDRRHPPQRGVGLELPHLLGDLRAAVHRGRRVAGTDGIDPDVAVGPLHREALGE